MGSRVPVPPQPLGRHLGGSCPGALASGAHPHRQALARAGTPGLPSRLTPRPLTGALVPLGHTPTCDQNKEENRIQNDPRLPMCVRPCRPLWPRVSHGGDVAPAFPWWLQSHGRDSRPSSHGTRQWSSDVDVCRRANMPCAQAAPHSWPVRSSPVGWQKLLEASCQCSLAPRRRTGAPPASQKRPEGVRPLSVPPPTQLLQLLREPEGLRNNLSSLWKTNLTEGS